MQIGLILSSAPGYSETFFRNKIQFLTEAGVEIIVFADTAESIETNYKIVRGFSWNGSILSKTKNLIKAMLRLSRVPLKARKLYFLNKRDNYSKRENILSLLSSAHILVFDLDWIHFGFATQALGRENLAKVLEAQMAASIRGFDIGIYPLKHPNCYQLLWKRLNKLHYISDDLYSLALKQGFDSKISHQKITPAINVSVFQGNEITKFNSPVRILTVARLNWKKGLDYTLESLSLLNRKFFDFTYTVIGEGKDLERLLFACHQLGIKDKVSFVGKKSHQEVREYYQKSDIYLQYSIQEGFCNAVLEAQAMGLLCLVSDAEGLSENVLHNKTGWVVPKRRPDLLAQQILKVIDLTYGERTKISEAAIKRVKEQFNLEKQKREFLEFYR